MKYLKSFNENTISELPSFLKKVVRKIGDWSLVPKILIALKNTPKDISEAYDYLSKLFNISGDKESFINMMKTELSSNVSEKINIDAWKKGLIYTVIIVGGFLLYFIFGLSISSSYEDECVEFLNDRGYTEIKVLGWDPTGEREDDITSMEFVAVDDDGKEIHGVVIVSGDIIFGETYQIKFYKK